MKNKLILILGILILCVTIFAEGTKTGNLMGRVIDAETNYPLENVAVLVKGLEMGAYTNEKGQYSIMNIPVGNYNVIFQIIGAKTQQKTDIIIRSNRTTSVNGELKKQAILMEGISVTNMDYFSETLKHMRRYTYSDVVDKYFALGSHLKQRDSKSVKKTVSGFIKLLQPDESFSKTDVQEYLEIAMEMRRRVKEQLKRIGGMEFWDTNFSFIDK